jgi:hypothetical protein
MRASRTKLSLTTTSSGLIEGAHKSPGVVLGDPAHPITVTRSRIALRAKSAAKNYRSLRYCRPSITARARIRQEKAPLKRGTCERGKVVKPVVGPHTAGRALASISF